MERKGNTSTFQWYKIGQIIFENNMNRNKKRGEDT